MSQVTPRQTIENRISVIKAMIEQCNGSPFIRKSLERDLAAAEAEKLELESAALGYGG